MHKLIYNDNQSQPNELVEEFRFPTNWLGSSSSLTFPLLNQDTVSPVRIYIRIDDSNHKTDLILSIGAL